MEIDDAQIRFFNSKTAWNSIVLEGFSLGMFQIMPRVIHLSRSRGSRISGRHSHQVWEFNIIISGMVQFYWKEQSVILKAGDVFFAPPGIQHGWRLLSPDFLILGVPTSISCLGNGAASTQTISDAMNFVCYHSHDNPDILPHSTDMIRLLLERPAFYRERSRILLQSIYLELFGLLFPQGLEFLEDDPAGMTLGLSGKRIAEILEYHVNENMNKPVAVGDVCKRFHLSQCQLNRICRRETGMTTSNYIAHRKIGLAKHLLENTERPVKDIAMTTGYPNINYFCRLFKKETGLTPKEYRNQSRT